MTPEQRFIAKHYWPNICNLNLNYFKQLYKRLPVFITTLPTIPQIQDFERDLKAYCKNDYVSKYPIEVNVINVNKSTVTNMHAYLHISFNQNEETFTPVHIFRIRLEDAIVHYTIDIK